MVPFVLRLPPPIDDLQALASTIAQEAGGEPFEGKLGVGYVIVTRATRAGRSILDTVLAPAQFSAWNTDAPTRLRLDTTPPEVWAESYKAACAAAFGLLPDPTHGATHYLNEAATRAGRPHRDLPSWFDEAKVTVRLGRHTFLRLAA